MCRNVVGADGCIENFTCMEYGNFAKCPLHCAHEYHQCKEFSDTYDVPKSCIRDNVYDPDKGCVDVENCRIDV